MGYPPDYPRGYPMGYPARTLTGTGGTQVHRYTGTQVHRYTGTQVHRYTGTQVHRYTGTQVHRYTGTQVHRYTGTQVQPECQSQGSARGPPPDDITKYRLKIPFNICCLVCMKKDTQGISNDKSIR